MFGNGDLAKILYWSCVLWPVAGIIGIYACHHQRAKIRCHFIVTIILFFITVASAFIHDDFYLSVIWKHDELTSFLRVMIAIGSIIASIVLKFMVPGQLSSSGKQKKLSYSLGLYQLIICTAMMAVAINNFFIAQICLHSMIFLSFLACFIHGGGEQIQAAWEYFRYMLFFMIMALMGVFILELSVGQTYPLLPRFGSFILAFSIVQMIGLFPVFITFLRFVNHLPTLIGSIIFFIIPVAFLSLFIRLFQISSYQNPQSFLMILGLISFIIIIIKENDDPFLYSPFLITILAALAGIFSNEFQGLYSFCLFITVLVIYAPLGYILRKSPFAVDSRGWFVIAISAFPPFGIFFACAILIASLFAQFPWLGSCLFLLFFVRGFFLFKKNNIQLFSRNIFTKESGCLLSLIFLPSLVIPIIAKYWLFQIAMQFIQK